MEGILTAAAVMAGLGLFFGAVLAFANRFLSVEEDPRVEGVERLLPGSNCGACGEPGCLPLAEKLVSGVAAKRYTAKRSGLDSAIGARGAWGMSVSPTRPWTARTFLAVASVIAATLLLPGAAMAKDKPYRVVLSPESVPAGGQAVVTATVIIIIPS